MKGIIFDLDGVLINSMPSHFEAWRIAFNEIANIDVNERTVYLLEGMRGIDLAKNVLELHNISANEVAPQITKRKSEIFRSYPTVPKPFTGVQSLLERLTCRKAVVSGSSKEDVTALLEQLKNIKFEVIVTADDVNIGKPDPLAFTTALRGMNIYPQNALVVENAPLGIDAANTAGIQSLALLNNSPLYKKDFDGKIDSRRIFANIASIAEVLSEWCQVLHRS
jgi:HAD superfamily hydrolase (TIGR01509 family)